MSSRHAGRLVGNGKYELISRLGGHAQGDVWLARHLALERQVAVKLLGDVSASGFSGHARFLSEARTASLLRHDNSARLLDYGSDEGEFWLVMEYLEGTTLAAALKEQNPFAARRAIAIATQMLAALSEAHEYGIVRHALTPQDVMLVASVHDDGHAFEQVKILSAGPPTLFQGDHDLAALADYVSPEQVAGQTPDPRSDVYVVGLLLYQMLGGKLPFQGVTRDSAISPRLEQLMLRSLEADPADRFESSRVFRAALLALPEAIGIPSETASKPRASATIPGMPRIGIGVTVAMVREQPAALITPVTGTTRYREHPGLKRLLLSVAAMALVGVGFAGYFALGGPAAAGPITATILAVRTPEQRVRVAAPVLVQEAALKATPAATLPSLPSLPTAAPSEALAFERQPELVATSAAAAAAATVPVATIYPEKIATTAPAAVKAIPALATRPAPRKVVAEPVAALPVAAMAPIAVTPALVQVEAPAAPAPAPRPEPNRSPNLRPRLSLAAQIAIEGLVVAGSLPRSSILRGLEAARPALERCYRVAAQGAQRDLSGKLRASLVIDVDGVPSDVSVGSFALAGFTSCAQQVLARARSRERPDTGSALASFTLTISVMEFP